MSSCTIIMYHYVRDLTHSRYPELKGLDLKKFRAQLDYLQTHYTFIAAEDIRECLDTGCSLPDKACLLSFDDGYLDHYLYVFPELVKRGIKGCFYPPVCAVQRNQVLAVNKIHLILAQNGYDQIDHLIHEFRTIYKKISSQGEFPTFENLYAQYATSNRFDTPEVIFFKRVLQYGLPEDTCTEILNHLFSSIMDTDEETLASELYVSLDMLQIMAQNGMHIGSHGNNHLWLDKLDQTTQESEIDASLAMLTNVYGNKDYFWSIAYPFGGNTLSLQKICAAKGCIFGLTTVVSVADVTPERRMFLSRLDTNDF